MARKPQARRQGSSGTPIWAWLLIGLFAGAVGYFAYQQIHSLKTSTSSELPIPNSNSKNKDADNTNEPPASGMDEGVLDTDYSFYDVLPTEETLDVSADEASAEQNAAPEQTATTVAVAPDKPQAEPATSAAKPITPDTSRYLLQAGAFERSADADDLKARIALSGESARVEQAEVNGKTMYRVRLGPYNDATAAERARTNLAGQGIHANRIAINNP